MKRRTRKRERRKEKEREGFFFLDKRNERYEAKLNTTTSDTREQFGNLDRMDPTERKTSEQDVQTEHYQNAEEPFVSRSSIA